MSKNLSILAIIMLTLAVLLPVSVLAQQANTYDEFYEEACELPRFNSQIDVLLTDYLRTRDIDQSTDGALASIAALQGDLDAIYQECLEAQQNARAETLSSLLVELQAGGYVIYVRHTHTDRVTGGTSDRDGCEDQRNLTARGRTEAEFINEHYLALDLPVSRLISTELCRTLDTMELAFGEPEIIPRSELETTLADVLSVMPEPGTNTIIVAHIGTINRNFGLPIPFEEGDTYVFAPRGEDGFELVGRISLMDWATLADIAEGLAE